MTGPDVTAGTINYTTGAVTAPDNLSQVIASYAGF
jgi:hypothetical protein